MRIFKETLRESGVAERLVSVGALVVGGRTEEDARRRVVADYQWLDYLFEARCKALDGMVLFTAAAYRRDYA